MLLNQKKLKKKRIIYFFLQKKNINFFLFLTFTFTEFQK